MRKLTPFFVLMSLIGVTLVVSSLGTTQSVFKNDVGLQATTPGTSQSGHLNVTGTARAGVLHGASLTVTGGAAAGRVLKSDAAGNATWQEDGLTFPFSATAVSPLTPMVTFTNNSQRETMRLIGQGPISGGVLEVIKESNWNGAAIYALSSGDSDHAIKGESFGINTIAAHFRSTGSAGIGVLGINSNTSGGIGAMGTTSAGNGIGVKGENLAGGLAGYFAGRMEVTGRASIGTSAANGQLTVLAPTGTGISVTTANSSVGPAIFARSANNDGIYGETSGSGNQAGGYFVASTPAAYGLVGQNRSSSGGVGVAGTTSSVNGIGVLGENIQGGLGGYFIGRVQVTDRTSIGTANTNGLLTLLGNQSDVLHITNSGTGRGMYVLSPSDTGIWTNTTTGIAGIDARGARSDGYGVVATNNGAAAWAVFGFGRSGATGVKSFRIDHPLDPENKFLLHYSAEGPEPMNVYSGNVTTDAKGEAWVQLPDYFGDINRDLRYTLTVVEDDDSDDFVMAKVARKVQGNRFKIRTSAPNVEVSWRVEGVRNDRWMQRYGAPSEMQKSDAQRGRYQHPELYDLPQNYSMLPAPVEAKSKK